MPFNGAGVYSPPSPPVYPAVTGQLIRAADYNAVISDLAAALTNCVTKDNQSTVPTLTLGALTVTGVAALGAGATVSGETVLTRRYTTGELVSSFSSTAPVGTLALDGRTIGSATSGGTARANADTQALFELLWATASNTLLPIQDAAGGASTRGLTASADFAANKRLPLPAAVDGQALVASVSTAPITATLGSVLSHTHVATVTDPGHFHVGYGTNTAQGVGPGSGILGSAYGSNTFASTTGVAVSNANNAGGTSMNQAAGMYAKFYIAL